MFRRFWIVIFAVVGLCVPVAAAEDEAPDSVPAAKQPATKKAPGAAKSKERKGNNDVNAGDGKEVDDKDPKKGAATIAPEVVPDQSNTNVWMANHSVRLRSDGNIPGQIRTVDANGDLVPAHAKVQFLQDGELAGKTITAENGFFQAVGLKAGHYDVISVGRDSFGAFALSVASAGASQAPPVRAKAISYRDGGRLPMTEEERWEHLILSQTVLPAVDLFKAGQVIAYRIESFREPGATPVEGSGSGVRLPPAMRSPSTPKSLGTPTGMPRLGALLKSDKAPAAILTAALPSGTRWRAIGELPASMLPYDGPWHSGHSLAIRNDGKLLGRLQTFDGDGQLIPVIAHIHFIQNGRLVGMTLANSEGRFGVDGLSAGNYSVVIAGENALGAFSIRVLPPQYDSSFPPNPEGKANLENPTIGRTVAYRAIQNGGDLFISTTRWANFTRVRELMRENSFLRAGMMQPGLGNGGGGPAPGGGPVGGGGPSPLAGGGGGGGGGGLGGALAGAGLIGAAAALGSNTSTNSSASTANQ